MIRTKLGHFWISFDNGYTLSCFNGYGSYTENHFAHKKAMDKNLKMWESKEVEIAIIRDEDGQLVTQDIIESDDSVKTINVNELVEIMNIVSKLEKSDKE